MTNERSAVTARWIFLATILTGSFLLFLIQPMIARMALPRLGGAPAVWNSAMLVYQALLLGGYAYAHYLGRFTGRQQAAIHLILFAIAALWLPIGLADILPPADAAPELWVPYLLALSIGPIFFAVAAQAPLMQRWYSLASGGRDPYALYAASNLGSFGGLIAYPLLVEPNMPVAAQRWLWTGGYVVLALLVAGCALTLPRGAITAAVRAPVSDKPTARRWLHWIILAAVPSGLMLSTTTHLTTDIVAMPLLWVIPLGLYLLSFSVAFATRRAVPDAIIRLAPLAILLFGGLALGGSQDRPFLGAFMGLLLLFVVAVALHGEMYRLRPAPDRLTSFYLAMSVGGVIGGLFAALLAPVAFDWTYEHPLLIFAAGLLVPQTYLIAKLRAFWGDGQRARIRTLAVALAVMLIALASIAKLPLLPESPEPLAFGLIALIGILCLGRRAPYAVALAGVLLVFGGYREIALSLKGDARVRSYFGVYTIRDFPADGMRVLAHGTTFHGVQVTIPGHETQPTSYYFQGSGIGEAMTSVEPIYGRAARVGVVGLGAGTLACYAKPGQSWTFYEIDPAVVKIARDPARFSFLSRCLPDVPIRIGDARLTLDAAVPASLDLLALDAFSSDSVPMHLLTREAFATYGAALERRGLLMVHISNRFLDLEPVVAAAAADGGWTGAVLDFRNPSTAQKDALLQASSLWVALSRDPAVIADLRRRTPGWRALGGRPGFQPWTDDFSSILPLVKAWEPATQKAP